MDGFQRKKWQVITLDSWVMRDFGIQRKALLMEWLREPRQLKSSGVKSLIDSALRRQGLRKNLVNGKKRHDVQLDHGFRKFHETELIKANLKQVDINIPSRSCKRGNDRSLLQTFFRSK